MAAVDRVKDFILNSFFGGLPKLVLSGKTRTELEWLLPKLPPAARFLAVSVVFDEIVATTPRVREMKEDPCARKCSAPEAEVSQRLVLRDNILETAFSYIL